MRFVLVGFVWLGWSMGAMAAPSVVPTVSVEPAQDQVWQVTGQAVSRYRLPLSFRVGGQVSKRLVDLGSSVNANQLLARLDATDYQLALEQSQANLASAQSRLENASRERNRLSKLYKDQLISLQDLQRAETFEVESQQAVVAAEAALKLATNQRRYSELTAPKSGQVTEVNVEEGQSIAAGQPAFVLLAGATEAEVFLPAEALQKSNQKALLNSVDQAISCQASLRLKRPISDAITKQTLARYRLSDCTGVLAYGSVVRLQFKEPAQAEQRQVPITAIFNQGHQAYVWQVVNHQVKATPVSVVRVNQTFATLVAEALPVGAQIVSQGTHRLVAGQTVSVLK